MKEIGHRLLFAPDGKVNGVIRTEPQNGFKNLVEGDQIAEKLPGYEPVLTLVDQVIGEVQCMTGAKFTRIRQGALIANVLVDVNPATGTKLAARVLDIPEEDVEPLREHSNPIEWDIYEDYMWKIAKTGRPLYGRIPQKDQEEVRELIVSLWKGGQPIEAIANHLNRPELYVRAVVKPAQEEKQRRQEEEEIRKRIIDRWEARGYRGGYTPGTPEHVKKLYDVRKSVLAGRTDPKTAEELGMSFNTVVACVKELIALGLLPKRKAPGKPRRTPGLEGFLKKLKAEGINMPLADYAAAASKEFHAEVTRNEVKSTLRRIYKSAPLAKRNKTQAESLGILLDLAKRQGKSRVDDLDRSTAAKALGVTKDSIFSDISLIVKPFSRRASMCSKILL